MNDQQSITNQEPPVKASDTQPRICPQCGASVSSRAKTCLICGADLQIAPEPAQEPAPLSAKAARPFNFKNLLIQVLLTLIGLAVLAGIVWGFVTLVRGASSTLQTPTPTFTSTHTPAPTPEQIDTPTPAPTTGPSATPIPPRQHTVKAGETLSVIAELYDTTVEALKAANNLQEDDILQIGQVLVIPGTPPTPSAGATSGTIIHVVQAGETLLGIAQRYGVPMATLQSLNGIDNPEQIKAGQQLTIPVGPTATPTQGPSPTPTQPPKYSAPPLLSPLEGAQFEGTEDPILLQWAATTLLRADEWYQITLERPGSGQAATEYRTRTTAFYVPAELFPSAEDQQRVFEWRVDVVRQIDDKPTYEAASLSGESRSFLWALPQATPTPTPGPTG